MSLYRRQSILKIVIETDLIDLASFTDHKIIFLDPDGIKGQWTATINGFNMEYELQTESLKRGKYQIQPVVYLNEKVLPGSLLMFEVEPGLLT